MTAILTKQNALDGAFIGGSKNPSSINCDEISAKTADIEQDLTVGEDINLGGISLKSQLINHAQALSVISSDINDHEERITSLEMSPGSVNELSYEDGLDAYSLDLNSLSKAENDEYNILEIKIDIPSDYSGNVFTINCSTLGCTADPSKTGGEAKIDAKNGKFTNPKIDSNNAISYIENELSARIYMSKESLDNPFDLFTSGFMKINFTGKVKQYISNKESGLINIKCNNVDAENCLKLYTSPLPNFYEMKSFGSTENEQYYYADWGYIPGTEEFDKLLDGQTFEFHDEVFGTDFKLTKQNNEWVGNNLSYNIPGSKSIKGETEFFKHTYQGIFIEQNDTNRYVLRNWIHNYSDKNPFEVIVEKGLCTFNDCEVAKYEDKDGYWSVLLKCTKKESCNFSASLNINGIEYTSEFGYSHSSYESESCYKVVSENCYKYIPFHYNSRIDIGNPPYGLILYMPSDKEVIFPIPDVSYKEGGNTFEFLAGCGYYSVVPRPEACSTLYTNCNIQTSGVVIGENIESHLFVLNSLGNTVDIANNRISELQNLYSNLQKQLNDMKNKTNWFNYIKDVVCIAGATVNFVGGPKALLSLAAEGISKVKRFCFAGEEVSEGAEAIVRDVDVLAAPREIRTALEFIEEIEAFDKKCFRYLCYGVDDNEEIKIDGEYEDFRINVPYLDVYAENCPSAAWIMSMTREQKPILLGEELTNKQLITAKAVKKLIDNHMKQLKTVDLSGYISKEEADGKYVLKTDILSTEKISQELSIATKFVNGTTNDEDKRTYITNLDRDLCNILKKSSLIVKGSCNNEDISGEYLYDSEDADYYYYKKGENTFTIYFFYYSGTFKYNGNYVVDLESVSYSYEPEVYDKYCIPNMNFVKDNYALKSELTNNNIEILKDDTIYNDNNEIFWNNLQEAVNDNNVLSSQLAINYIYKSTLDMIIEAAVLKEETTRSDRFNIEDYETQTLNDIDEAKDYEVLSEKSSMKMYYNLLDKIKTKQDSLVISTNKTDYETNKESTTIIPSLSLLNELISECDNKNEDGSLTLNSTNDTVLSVFSNNSYGPIIKLGVDNKNYGQIHYNTNNRIFFSLTNDSFLMYDGSDQSLNLYCKVFKIFNNKQNIYKIFNLNGLSIFEYH